MLPTTRRSPEMTNARIGVIGGVDIRLPAMRLPLFNEALSVYTFENKLSWLVGEMKERLKKRECENTSR